MFTLYVDTKLNVDGDYPLVFDTEEDVHTWFKENKIFFYFVSELDTEGCILQLPSEINK